MTTPPSKRKKRWSKEVLLAEKVFLAERKKICCGVLQGECKAKFLKKKPVMAWGVKDDDGDLFDFFSSKNSAQVEYPFQEVVRVKITEV